MNAWLGGTSSPVPATPSGPRVMSGSSALSGTKTVAPVLTVWSTPWSKNWPKKVNRLLNGGDRPTSVVMLGMNSVLCAGVQPAGTPAVVAVGSVVQRNAVAVGSCGRAGGAGAAVAGGVGGGWAAVRVRARRGGGGT